MFKQNLLQLHISGFALAIMACACTALPGYTQDAMQSDDMPPTAPPISPTYSPPPDSSNSQQNLTPPPDTVPPATQTPPVPDNTVILPDRPPIPVPPDINLPPPNGTGVAKPPLAWRTKAYRMSIAQDKKPVVNSDDLQLSAQSNSPDANSPDNSSHLIKHHRESSQQQDRLYAAGYDDTLLAIISSCPPNGFNIESMNSAAGQIIARSTDQSFQPAHIVFSVRTDSAGYTRVSASSTDSSISAAQLGAIMKSIENIVARKGSL